MENDIDRQAQEDEMEILSEILDADIFKKFASETSAISGQMTIKLHVPWDALKCQYKSVVDEVQIEPQSTTAKEDEQTEGANEVHQPTTSSANSGIVTKKKTSYTTLNLKHLPPLQLHFTLPSDYPSVSKPVFTLSSTWLYRDSLTFLCSKLDSLWEENQGMAILYTWYSFLEADGITSLGLGQDTVYDVSFFCDHQQSARRPMQRVSENVASSPVDSPACGAKILKRKQSLPSEGPSSRKIPTKSRYTKPSQQFDARAVFDRTPVPFIQYLINYEAAEVEAEFVRASHPCAICLMEKRGRDSILFKCGHIFCKECLREFFSLHITEGSLDSVKCPDVECKTVPIPDEVKRIVGEELFERYDTLLLSKVLDSMSDILVCPRISCGKPVMYDTSEKLANCAACGYSFCSSCKMVYHGVEPCRFVSGEARQLYDKYTGGSDDVKKFLEKTYGKKQMEILVQQTLSEDWVNSQSKKCPHCQVPIDKFEGCNKVTCFKCATYFCWICSTQLDKQNPYLHFNDPSSPCYNNLFLNVDAVNDEDDDWEILVDNNNQVESEDDDESGSDDENDIGAIIRLVAELNNQRRQPPPRRARRGPRRAQGLQHAWLGFQNRDLDSDSD